MKLHWRELAACRGMGTEIFFPTRGNHGVDPRAKAACAACPVRQPCLDDANKNGDIGYRGGLTVHAREQQQHRRFHGAAVEPYLGIVQPNQFTAHV